MQKLCDSIRRARLQLAMLNSPGYVTNKACFNPTPNVLLHGHERLELLPVGTVLRRCTIFC